MTSEARLTKVRQPPPGSLSLGKCALDALSWHVRSPATLEPPGRRGHMETGGAPKVPTDPTPLLLTNERGSFQVSPATTAEMSGPHQALSGLQIYENKKFNCLFSSLSLEAVTQH